MTGIAAIGYFLFSTAIEGLLFLLWMRFVMNIARINIFSPLSQTIFRMSNTVLMPLHRVSSKFNMKHKSYDWVCLLAIFMLELFKYWVMGLFLYPNPSGSILRSACLTMFLTPCQWLSYAIIARVILSWITITSSYQEIPMMIYRITEPMLSAIRSRLPLVSNLDFSPIIALVGLKIIAIFLESLMP